MKSTIQKAINEQINAELYSAYLYLSMAAYLDKISLSGFSHWMKMQANEEVSHAMKFYHFVYERGGSVHLKAIDQPPADFKSPLNLASHVLEHEKKVTGLIHKLYELAQAEKDYAFESLLKWFIDEQVEEEDNATHLVEKIKLAGEKGPGLFMFDKELGKREKEND